MKLDFRLRGSKQDPGIRDRVQGHLERLGAFALVSNARVSLERDRDAAPAWSARAHLEVPGPDLRAEARDHTAEAAWRKVIAALYAQIAHRDGRRRHRLSERRRLRPAGRAA